MQKLWVLVMLGVICVGGVLIHRAWQKANYEYAETAYALVWVRYDQAKDFARCPFDEKTLQENLSVADAAAREAWDYSAYLTEDKRNALADVMNTMAFAQGDLPIHCEMERLAFR